MDKYPILIPKLAYYLRPLCRPGGGKAGYREKKAPGAAQGQKKPLFSRMLGVIRSETSRNPEALEFRGPGDAESGTSGPRK